MLLLLGCSAAPVDVPVAAAPDAEQERAKSPTADKAPERIDVASWYPRTVSSDRGEAVLHAPQIESWDGFTTLKAWMAFEIRRTGSDDSFAGSVRFTAHTDTDLAIREVLLEDFVVDELHIDGLDDDAGELTLIRDALTALSRRVPLDLIIEHLPRDLPLNQTAGLGTEPPQIFLATGPALLLTTDGEPRFLPVEGTSLYFLLNTTWDVLRAGEAGALFLCYQGRWLTAGALDEEWEWATRLPDDALQLPETAAWSTTRACLPQGTTELTAPGVDVPMVFVGQRPSELLLLDGAPEWTAIKGTELRYARNTSQPLLQVDGQHFTLFSGRWFSAEELSGPWAYVAELPAAFATLPAEEDPDAHDLSHLRASIPGTAEAWEAALVASIPRTAVVDRAAAEELAVAVTYAGDPVFVPIGDTGLDYAANTSFQVLRYAGEYYLCYNATWLISSDPAGPWRFADRIPEAFAQIPPESPLFNTTFVEVRASDDGSVEYAYTAGYENAHITQEGTVVQGTGHDAAVAVSVGLSYGYYSGWPYYGYPYYWWPPTYGYGSWYDPGTGRYGEAVVAYGPYAAAGGAAVYNPETGVYGRGQAIWDSDEFSGRGFVFNPNTDTTIARNRYIDFDDNSGWSQRIATRGDGWRYKESEWEDGRMVTEFESSRGTEGQVVRGRDGDTLVSEGVVARGDRSAEFSSTRQREGDQLVSEGTITGSERSATISSVIEDGSYSGAIEGSEGGSGQIERTLDDGELSGGSTFTRGGKTIETDVTRTAEGVQREFETSGGGQGVSRRSGDDSGFAYKSGSGDIYAGRDGSVYKKTDDGWAAVRNPRKTPNPTYPSTGTYGTANRRGSYPTTSLNRDYQSRQRGFQRYSQHRQFGGAGRMGRARRR